MDVNNREFWDNEARLKALGKGKNSPLQMKASCWEGYEAKGTKKSPSGKKTGSGKVKRVNNCVKK
jgi:hypothetical protein|tara:strand:+ start:181 stop:375 length:195 start_codon:yes stop_codon:yes gene_type:complete